MATLFEYQQKDLETNIDLVRKGSFTHIFLIPYQNKVAPWSGIEHNGAAATENKPMGIICVSQAMDDPTLTPINEEVVFGNGKDRETTNDGYRVDPFNVEVKGNAVKFLMAAINQDQGTNSTIKHIGDYGLNGALLIVSHDGVSKSVMRTDLYVDMNVRIDTLPGFTDGTTTQTVSFYADQAQVYTADKDEMWAVEVFRQTVNILNTEAPNGIINEFDLGDGNSSGAFIPVALLVDPTAVGYKQFFPVMRVDAVTPGTSVLTFVQPKLTFPLASPPADEATLMMIYKIDTNVSDVPLGVVTLPVTDPMSIYFGYTQLFA